MSSSSGKKGRPRRKTAEPVEAQAKPVEPATGKKVSSGRNSAGKRRAITQGEPDPWAFDETTINLPKSMHNDWAQVMLGDCHELVKELPNTSVQFIYCDPPFG